MIAILGIPGSTLHTWERFDNRKSAEAWVQREHAQTLERNPALGSLPTEVISEREAARRRWQDGTRIYSA